MWQFAFGVSNRAVSVLVGFMHALFKFLATSSKQLHNLWKFCPKGLKGCHKFVDLKCPQFERYVVCHHVTLSTILAIAQQLAFTSNIQIIHKLSSENLVDHPFSLSTKDHIELIRPIAINL